MTIKSDKWIRKMCTPPTCAITEHRTGRWVFSHVSKEEVDNLNSGLPPDSKYYVHRRELAAEELAAWKPLISPFVEGQIRERDKFSDRLLVNEEYGNTGGSFVKNVYAIPGHAPKEKIVSFGTSSFGYDVRLANTFKVFTNVHNGLIDPLNMKEDYYVDKEGDYVIIPPNSYILGHTIETFDIPRDVMVVALGKSTYARCGAIVNVTPIEAGFKGQVVIEISNSTPLPLKVYANMGIAQFLFFQSNEECEVSYADRGGKYQGQTGITTAKV